MPVAATKPKACDITILRPSHFGCLISEYSHGMVYQKRVCCQGHWLVLSARDVVSHVRDTAGSF